MVLMALVLLYSAASTGRGASQDHSGPEKVTICQLAAERARYNHKLVEVTGFIEHGFEDFSLFDPGCLRSEIWIDYGGKAASGTTFCCPGSPNRSREHQLVVEGVPIPLVDDERFRSFDRLIHARRDTVVRATVVGRFFSGRPDNLSNNAFGRGYGHMGCCSLLAIERVTSVDPQDRDDVDYRIDPDQPTDINAKCAYESLEPLVAPIEAQKEAEADGQAWRFTDPKQVAIKTLAHLLNLDEKSIAKMGGGQTTPGRAVYKWRRPHSTQTGYMVVVSRPYWLSFYAADPKRVAWVAIAAYESPCVK
jgi:hypothetical protein